MKFAGRDGESDWPWKLTRLCFGDRPGNPGGGDDMATITAGNATGGDMVNGGKTVLEAVAEKVKAAEQIAII